MNHRDQSMSEVVIVLRSEYLQRLDEIVEQLSETGVGISSMDQELGSIEATCESNRSRICTNDLTRWNRSVVGIHGCRRVGSTASQVGFDVHVGGRSNWMIEDGASGFSNK